MSSLDQNGLHHSSLENIQGIAIGVFIVSLGLLFLKSAGLFVGQAAGIALIGAYLTDTPFGLWFFSVNAPFFLFGARRFGWRFTIRSILGVAGVSALSFLLPNYIQFDQVHPIAAALASGILTGLGILAALRHGAGLGGVSVMAAAVQAKTGFRAGYVQLIIDALIFIPAFFIFETNIVLYSLLGAFVINGIIAINHRPDWYQAKFD
ncbi:MAG: YitT family protein [Pseudomonadota bacterium]